MFRRWKNWIFVETVIFLFIFQYNILWTVFAAFKAQCLSQLDEMLVYVKYHSTPLRVFVMKAAYFQLLSGETILFYRQHQNFLCNFQKSNGVKT